MLNVAGVSWGKYRKILKKQAIVSQEIIPKICNFLNLKPNMQNYLNLLRDVKENGTEKSDRTGIGTWSVFGRQIRFDLSKGFPLVTTKKVHLKSIIVELLWFLRGDTNTKFLKEHNVSIWDEWQNENGDLGPIYGAQWRSWQSTSGEKIDQISELLESLKNNPDSRRHVVCAWNVGELSKMALHPCHCLFQFYVANNKLSCQLYQRSADIFLGVPFNIASYAILTLMLCQVLKYEPGEYVHTFGDLHLYKNHKEQSDLQLSREPKLLPKMNLNPDVKNLFDFKLEDFTLENYDPWPAIKAPVAV